MSSEAITRNDLTAILNEVLPPTPSEYKKLLWTNPAKELSDGLVALDLTDYDAVEIHSMFMDADWDAPANTTSIQTIDKGSRGALSVTTLDTTNASNASTFINIVTRLASVANTGVTFTKGQMTYAGGAYANWTSRCVPYKIYGIKYERVAPPQVGYMPEFENPVDVVSSMINSPYWTCPADGIIVASTLSSGSATGIYIQDNTLNIRACGMYQNTMANNTQLSCTAPVLKGHIYQRSYHSGQGSGRVYYYKFK